MQKGRLPATPSFLDLSWDGRETAPNPRTLATLRDSGYFSASEFAIVHILNEF